MYQNHVNNNAGRIDMSQSEKTSNSKKECETGMIYKMNANRHSALIFWMCCVFFLVVVLEKTAYGDASSPVVVTNPNGEIKIEISADSSGQLTWSVQRQDYSVLGFRCGIIRI